MNDFEGLDISMEEADGGSFIPEGEYPCIINVSEKTTSAAGNDYLKVELSVTGEKYNGWRVRKRTSIFGINMQMHKNKLRSEVTLIMILHVC